MVQTLPLLSDRPPSHRYLQIDTQAVAFPPVEEEVEPYFCSVAIYNVETVLEQATYRRSQICKDVAVSRKHCTSTTMRMLAWSRDVTMLCGRMRETSPSPGIRRGDAQPGRQGDVIKQIYAGWDAIPHLTTLSVSHPVQIPPIRVPHGRKILRQVYLGVQHAASLPISYF